MSVRLRTKWLWVQVQLQSHNLQISCPDNYRVCFHSAKRAWHDKNIRLKHSLDILHECFDITVVLTKLRNVLGLPPLIWEAQHVWTTRLNFWDILLRYKYISHICISNIIYIYGQGTSVCICCVVKINRKHNVCLTSFRILLILSHVCKWRDSQRLQFIY